MNSSHLRASVVGVGNTRYATMPELDAYDLGLWALKDALAHPHAFGGTVISVLLLILCDIVSGDPTLCCTVYDSGLTPMLLEALLTPERLPASAELLAQLI